MRDDKKRFLSQVLLALFAVAVALGDFSLFSSAARAVEPDTVPPVIYIDSPTEPFDHLTGTIDINVRATDNSGTVSRVEFWIDSVLKYTDTTAPYSYSWDSTTATSLELSNEGAVSHMVVVRAYDPSGNFWGATRLLRLDSQGTDETIPTVSIDTPPTGTVPGTVPINVSATDASGVEKVFIYIDSVLKATFTSPPYTYTWNTTNLPNGAHFITARARDPLQNNNMVTTQVTVNNPGRSIGIDQQRLTWNDDPKTTVVVQWRSLGTSTSSVAYGTTTSLGQTSTGSSQLLNGVYQHQVKLTGLTPGTRYYYKISGDTNTFSFKTAPSATTGGFKFLHTASQGYQEESQSLAPKLAAENPDFWILAGGFTYTDEGPYCWNHLALEPCLSVPGAADFVSPHPQMDGWMNMNTPLWSKAPIVLSYGDHETPTKDNQPFLKRFAQPSNPTNAAWNGQKFSFDYGPIHFVVMAQNFHTSDPEATWLKNDLAASNAKWKIVTVRVSPYSIRGAIEDPALAKIADEYGVDLVLGGLRRLYMRTYPLRWADNDDQSVVTNSAKTGYVDPDTIYIVAAGGNRIYGSLKGPDMNDSPGGLPRSGPPSYLAAMKGIIPTYAVYEMSSDTNTITAKGVDVDGNVFDTFTITKGGTPPTPLVGDFNGDGKVDRTDLTDLSNHWPPAPYNATYDLNNPRDNLISPSDAGILLSNWKP